jgi:hypothetical protein
MKPFIDQKMQPRLNLLPPFLFNESGTVLYRFHESVKIFWLFFLYLGIVSGYPYHIEAPGNSIFSQNKSKSGPVSMLFFVFSRTF